MGVDENIKKIEYLLRQDPEGRSELVLKDLEIRRKYANKGVEHLFHYTQSLEAIKAILREGFKPSFCAEEFPDGSTWYIPMVSFCNIAIAETNKYLRYGNWGIGLSRDWAIKNGVSPVTYIHEGTPFTKQIHDLSKFLMEKSSKMSDREFEIASVIYDTNRLMFRFFKNWNSNFKGLEVNAFQEREWRYTPSQEYFNSTGMLDLLNLEDCRHSHLIDEWVRTVPKKRLEDHLKFTIDDVEYLIAPNKEGRKKLIGLLYSLFKPETVWNKLIANGLTILTIEQIENDF